MTGGPHELERAAEHVLAHQPHQRMSDRRRRGRARLEGVVLRAHVFALAGEHRGQPLRAEDVERGVDQDPAFDGADQRPSSAVSDAWNASESASSKSFDGTHRLGSGQCASA